MTPLDPRVAAAAEQARRTIDDAEREALKARLIAASGNVSEVARAMLPDRKPQAGQQAVHRAIDRLGLRDWLRKACPVSAVQRARRAKERNGVRTAAKRG